MNQQLLATLCTILLLGSQHALALTAQDCQKQHGQQAALLAQCLKSVGAPVAAPAPKPLSAPAPAPIPKAVAAPVPKPSPTPAPAPAPKPTPAPVAQTKPMAPPQAAVSPPPAAKPAPVNAATPMAKAAAVGAVGAGAAVAAAAGTGAKAPAPVPAAGPAIAAPLPDFAYTTPTYDANPGKRGWCYPQCVEFIKVNLGLPGGRTYAKEYWTSPHTGYANYAQGAKRAPRPGDIMVWSGALNPNTPKGVCPATGCGHVAIVKSVNLAKGTLTRVDANWKGSCAVVEHSMTISGDDQRGYTIAGSGSGSLLGWQSK